MEWGTLFYDKHKYVYISYFHWESLGDDSYCLIDPEC
jgi:hypothetical protein